MTGFFDLLKRLAMRIWKHIDDEGFKLPDLQYGLGDTERCVEIPWALSWYRGERRVLDIGYANAEDRYIDSINALNIPELYGLDLVGRSIPGIRPVVGDARSMPFRDGAFDMILCISTLEHIGRDNTIYFNGPIPQDPEGDLSAIREMARITRRNGKIVITVPYGRRMNYGWFQQYDRQSLDRLISASGCRLIRKDLYIYRAGWHQASEDELEDVLYKDNEAPAASGLACILLRR
ncbi:class I SAM-dependent methyltransferase [Methanothrix thermoacetophila]|uniref:Methyltransferase type 11 n=1 Tax=Methanothrix thermoacetophila (strain DSM 6194 / JCM 14653 / NBRC 101360 / PT) TaxID=349307 RepID=A0B827_METTP|nr:class I SAM-dependent methyltransferase [Methanothrix thermoacetophila]ABK14851.1 Methyltransferase type 11 [Methanothrix thermoacetophila PT]